MQQRISSERAHGQADAELDTQLEHVGTGRTQQHRDAKHGRQSYHYIGKGCIQVSYEGWMEVLKQKKSNKPSVHRQKDGTF